MITEGDSWPTGCEFESWDQYYKNYFAIIELP